jgi:hypothetical protein
MVVEHLSPSIVRIYNDHSGQYRKCKTDFIKLYNEREVWTLREYEDKVRNGEFNDDIENEYNDIVDDQNNDIINEEHDNNK